MKLPLALSKTYTTDLTKEEVLGFVHERLNRKHKTLFISIPEFKGSIQDSTFELRQIIGRYPGNNSVKIAGKILSTNPTQIQLTVRPLTLIYIQLIFLLIFMIFFIKIGLNADTITVNGVEQMATLSDRLLIIGLSSILPLFVFFFLCIRPVRKTEKWLKEKWKLREMKK